MQIAAQSSASSSMTLGEAADLYERLAEIPTIAKVEFTGSHDEYVNLTLNCKDHATMRTSQKTLQIPIKALSDASTAHLPSAITTDPSVKLDFPFQAPARSLRVVLREQIIEDQKKKRFVQVWEGDIKVFGVEVTEAHGSFCTDDTFSSSSAVRDSIGRYSILYQADVAPQNSSEDSLARFKYHAPMGEKYAKDVQPALFLLRFAFGHAELEQIIASVPDRILAQASFVRGSCEGANSSGSDAGLNPVVAVGYDAVSGGRRLGQIYCTNRPSVLQVFNVTCTSYGGISIAQRRPIIKTAFPRVLDMEDDHVQTLSTKGRSARSPRVVPGSEDETKGQWTVVWLETPSGGPHNSSSAIMRAKHRMPSNPLERLRGGNYIVDEIVPFDYQWRGHEGENLSYQGQFLGQLPRLPFIRRGHEWGVAFSTVVSTSSCIRIHSVETGLLWESTALDTNTTIVAASTVKSRYLASNSGIGTPPWLSLVEVDFEEGGKETLLWSPLTSSENIYEELKVVETSVHDVAYSSVHDEEEAVKGSERSSIKAIVVSSSSETDFGPRPMVLFPHGGPHSASTTDWSPGVAALVILGYSVIMPNYHGSTGYWPGFVDSLIGKCGRLDIDDCVATIKYAIDRGLADKDQIFYQGGSHGGFIGCHVAGREDVKDLWKAIALRNPVTHIGEMWPVTDIRDWTLAELGLPYAFQSPSAFLSPEHYRTLAEVSPARLIEHVEAPVLMLLGEIDQRVPPTQGLAYYHGLRSRIDRMTHEQRAQSRLEAECLWFKGADHALDTVESSRGAWLATWKWFEEARTGESLE